jgi:hypothetical protein
LGVFQAKNPSILWLVFLKWEKCHKYKNEYEDFEKSSKTSGNIQKVYRGGNGKRSKSIILLGFLYISHITYMTRYVG